MFWKQETLSPSSNNHYIARWLFSNLKQSQRHIIVQVSNIPSTLKIYQILNRMSSVKTIQHNSVKCQITTKDYYDIKQPTEGLPVLSRDPLGNF